MSGSYVKSSAIHKSFNRAINLHATSNFEIRDNVAYNIMGHAYFLETGAEVFNVLSGNLGAVVVRKLIFFEFMRN